MPLVFSLTEKLVATLTNPLDLTDAQVPLEVNQRYRWTTGVGADQADKLWQDRNTLAPSATTDIDLSGSLPDGLGGTIALARIKLIKVTAAAGNANNVNVSRAAANGVPLFLASNDGIPVLPGGSFRWDHPGNGITVTAGTGDLITFTNSAGGTSVTYDVVIIGASA